MYYHARTAAAHTCAPSSSACTFKTRCSLRMYAPDVCSCCCPCLCRCSTPIHPHRRLQCPPPPSFLLSSSSSCIAHSCPSGLAPEPEPSSLQGWNRSLPFSLFFSRSLSAFRHLRDRRRSGERASCDAGLEPGSWASLFCPPSPFLALLPSPKAGSRPRALLPSSVWDGLHPQPATPFSYPTLSRSRHRWLRAGARART